MKKIRWGLVGCGDIAGKRVAPALRDLENCELKAVSRDRFELAEDFAREFGAGKWYKNWQDLVKEPDIDAVYLATPVYLHAQQAIEAAARGKHVLSEKPMGITALECDSMIRACETGHVILGTAYYRRFYPVIERIKTLLNKGSIGRPVLADINAFESFDRKPEEERYWLLEKEKSGGGPMMDFGCHRIEILHYLFGDITSVKSDLLNIHFKREVEDTACTSFVFDTGACAALRVTHAASEAQDTLNIFGTEGSIHVPTLNSGRLLLVRGDDRQEEYYPPHENVHLPLIRDFTEAVINGTRPAVDGITGRKVAKILDIIYGRQDRR